MGRCKSHLVISSSQMLQLEPVICHDHMATTIHLPALGAHPDPKILPRIPTSTCALGPFAEIKLLTLLLALNSKSRNADIIPHGVASSRPPWSIRTRLDHRVQRPNSPVPLAIIPLSSTRRRLLAPCGNYPLPSLPALGPDEC